MSSVLQYARSLREEDSREPGTPGLEQRGVEVVPKDERTVGFLGFVRDMGRFLHHHDQLLAGALSEQGIAGTVAMRSAFGINGRYIASVVMFIVGSAGSAFSRAWLVQPRMR